MGVDENLHNYQYLCGSWQALLQQLVYQVGRGYRWYSLTHYPEQKRDKWLSIDRKLIKKYDCAKSKFQRYRAKGKGEAAYMFIRWEHIALILRTTGELRPEDDTFYDTEKKDITLQISPLVGFNVHHKRRGHTITAVYLTRDTYRGLKAVLEDVAHKEHLEKPAIAKVLLKEWDKINGFPAFAGILEQKTELLRHVLNLCRRYKIPLTREDFRFNSRRKIIKVWIDHPPENANH
jgi:hypothetical protein